MTTPATYCGGPVSLKIALIWPGRGQFLPGDGENMGMHQQEHWEAVYCGKATDQVSWFCTHLRTSLALIERATRGNGSAAIIDVGGGASTLVDDLIERGYQNLTVLDSIILELALKRSPHKAHIFSHLRLIKEITSTQMLLILGGLWPHFWLMTCLPATQFTCL